MTGSASSHSSSASSTGGPLRIAIIEDHQLLTAALSAALQADGHQVVAPPLTSTADIGRVLRPEPPEVALLDLDLGPLGRGEDLLPVLTGMGTRVLVVSGTSQDWRVGRCLDSGAWGWVPKSADFTVLLDTILRAGAGRPVLDPVERDRLLGEWREQRVAISDSSASFQRLSRREAEVLALLMEGLTVDRIAADSYVSVTTVRTQVRAILGKLDVTSQLEAVAKANRAGWSPPHDSGPRDGDGN